MSGIAKFLVKFKKKFGTKITGYDDNNNSNIYKNLIKYNIQTLNLNQLEKLETKPDLIIFSAAIKQNHPHLLFAKNHNIKIISRAEIIGEISKANFNKVISITGSHGKTTTASLITEIFTHCEKQPSYIIGGLLQDQKENASFNSNKYLILESCESDKSFLYLNPDIAIITNIDHEHLNLYQNKIENLEQEFTNFCYKIDKSGVCIISLDNKYTRNIINK